jgi:hypothetical protein
MHVIRKKDADAMRRRAWGIILDLNGGDSPDDNPEYVRGQVELYCDLFGIHMDEKEWLMGAVFRPPKVPVLVYAYHTFESGGGFDWAPFTDENLRILTETLATDRDHGNYDSGTLVSLSIARNGQSIEEVTEFFEWQLQDAIEVGTVGHIIARFNFEPVQNLDEEES